MYKIGRPINGIGLNGLEYLLDENENIMEFKTPEEAKAFLRENGHEDWTDDEFEDSYMFRYVHSYGELSDLLLDKGVDVIIDWTDFDDSETPIEDVIFSRCGYSEGLIEQLVKFIQKYSGYNIVLQDDEELLGLIIDVYDGEDNIDGATYWYTDYELPF